MTRVRKTYELHEGEYRRIRTRKLRHWNDREGNIGPKPKSGIDPNDELFMADVLAQEWAPKKGKAIELGCGSAPLLRWLWSKGFTGMGVDVSPTAIQMAKEQSRKCRGLNFTCADLLKSNPQYGKYDLVLDGRWLHCITQPKDRAKAFSVIRKLMRKGGIFVMLGMCGPIDMKSFAASFPNQRFLNDTVYVTFEGARKYVGAIEHKGIPYAPIRHIGHWKRLLVELKSAGLTPRLIRLNHPFGKDPVGALCLTAMASS